MSGFFLFGCCSNLLNTICRLFVDHGFKDQAVRLQVNMYELCQGCILVVGTIDENKLQNVLAFIFAHVFLFF